MIDILTKKFIKKCPICSVEFTATNNAQVYCTHKCRSERQRKVIQSKDWRTMPKNCKECGKEFIIPANSSPIRGYCSDECQLIGYRKNSREYNKLKPEMMKEYNKRRWAKYGTDSVVSRIYKKYPDLPKCCEAEGCNESRVIDFAHKPEFKRNGAYRTLRVYQRHMFWVLCPTHHALIDRGVLQPSEIGLQ